MSHNMYDCTWGKLVSDLVAKSSLTKSYDDQFFQVPMLPEQTSLIEEKIIKEPKPSVPKKKLKRSGFVISTMSDTETQSKKLKRKESKETESDGRSPGSRKATTKLQKPDKDTTSTSVTLKKPKKKISKLQKPKTVQIKVWMDWLQIYCTVLDFPLSHHPVVRQKISHWQYKNLIPLDLKGSASEAWHFKLSFRSN